MVNEDSKLRLSEKVSLGEIGPEDIYDYMELFCEICNENEEVKEEIEGWDRKFQFIIDKMDNIWLKIFECKFSWGRNEINEEPDITLEMDGNTTAGILSGEIDATSAYMSNLLKVIGPVPDAVKFKTLTDLVREELIE